MLIKERIMTDMTGGYQVVATALNGLHWPDGRTVDRRQVEMWFVRQTRNHNGDPPPEPVSENPQAGHSEPYYEFGTGPWATWALGGVRGTNGRGWVYPVREGEGKITGSESPASRRRDRAAAAREDHREPPWLGDVDRRDDDDVEFCVEGEDL
jgi:hypothetical protein